MEDEERLVTSTCAETEAEIENVLRPKSMDGYVGQEKVKNNVAISMAAAKKRNDALDHVLLYGPAGLGKTTLAHIIANEMGTQLKVTSGPAIEILYPAMEDFTLDFIIGKGPSAKNVQLPLPRFTLIGATTRAGMLSSPLRDRFGLICRLETYEKAELAEIVTRAAKMLQIQIEPAAAEEIAVRSRGTPRIANRLLKRVRDYSVVKDHEEITLSDAKNALKLLEIDELGLDFIDIRLKMPKAKAEQLSFYGDENEDENE